MDKGKLIEAEAAKLRKLFKGSETPELAHRLIGELAFLSVELRDLKGIIIAEGSVCTYRNGANQYGTMKHPAFVNYTNGLKLYAALVKQLNDLLPAGGVEKDNELIQFLKNGE